MGPTVLSATLYSPRWGHNDDYVVTFKEEGITIERVPRTAKADWDDVQGLLWSESKFNEMLLNESIQPPHDIEGLIGHLWQAWRDNRLSDEQAQSELDAFVGYLNACTHAKPKTDFWKSIF